MELPKPLDLEGLRNILVLAPHPDDETLGCGGTLIRLSQTARIDLLLVTDGAGAGGLPPGSAKIRFEELRRASAILGISEIEALDYPDGAFVADQAFEQVLKKRLLEKSPDAIFLPSAEDYHPDHALVGQALVRLLMKGEIPAPLFFYEVWAPVKATHVVDITEVMDQKTEAIRCHRTALDCGDYLEAIAGLNRYRGLYLGKGRYAEAFERVVPEGS